MRRSLNETPTSSVGEKTKKVVKQIKVPTRMPVLCRLDKRPKNSRIVGKFCNEFHKRIHKYYTSFVVFSMVLADNKSKQFIKMYAMHYKHISF